MSKIIPGILEKEWVQIEKKLEIIRPFSRAVHIDVLDGKFSEDSSFLDPEPFKKYKDDFFMEVHLMVNNPTQYLKSFAAAGFKRFLGHVEKMKDTDEFIAEGQILGEVGLSLDVSSPIESIAVPYDDLDLIFLMSVKAGKSGQVFLPVVLEKIKKIRQNSQIPIEIDGGINEETIVKAKEAGASRFVVTSAIFASSEPMRSYEKLLALAK
jgi:ribulose-phosphate 3-epimerase